MSPAAEGDAPTKNANREAFARSRDAVDAPPARDVRSANADAITVAAVVLRAVEVLPRIPGCFDDLRSFDVGVLDRLVVYVGALRHANARLLTMDPPADPLAPLATKGMALRKWLVDPRARRNIRGGRGYGTLSLDLELLALAWVRRNEGDAARLAPSPDAPDAGATVPYPGGSSGASALRPPGLRSLKTGSTPPSPSAPRATTRPDATTWT